MNNTEIKNIIARELERNGTIFAGIFGSFARGEENAESDIDILVRFKEPKSLFEIVRMEQKLGESVGRKVEIVTEKALHPYIAPSVRQDLQPIYGER